MGIAHREPITMGFAGKIARGRSGLSAQEIDHEDQVEDDQGGNLELPDLGFQLGDLLGKIGRFAHNSTPGKGIFRFIGRPAALL
jgi:hypothetical protein